MASFLDANQAHISSQGRRFLRRIIPVIAAPATQIAINSGLQSGLTHRFEATSLVIGSDDKSDLVLLDDDIALGHVTVHIQRSLFGEVASVTTSETNVVFAGEAVKPGVQTPFETLPTRLSIAGTHLDLAPFDPNEGAHRPWWKNRWVRVGLLIGLPLLFVLPVNYPQGLLPGGTPSSRFVVEFEPEVKLQPVAAVDAPVSASDLRYRISTSGFADMVRVRAVAGGLLAEGTVPQSRMSEWHKILQWYDSASADELLVSKVKPSSELSELPPIASIRLSEPRGVILADKRRVGLGEELKDGWVLQSLTNTGMVLTRDGESFGVAF